jgi:hypothetical protein
MNEDILEILHVDIAGFKESHYIACGNSDCKRKKVDYNESGEPICKSCNNLTNTQKVLILSVRSFAYFFNL